jgi:hypothetical protein
MVLADFTADGRLDVITLNFGNLSFWRGTGTGTLINREDIPLPAGPAYNEILPVDMNNDGLLDLVLKTDGAGIAILNATGAGDFGFVQMFPAPSGTHLVSADFNEDGKKDLFQSLNDPSLSMSGCILYGNGDLSISTASYFRGGGPGTYCVTTDLNQDGHADLVLTNAPQEISVWLGRGDGSFGSGLLSSSFIYQGPDSTGGDVVVAEMTGDAHPDLVLNRTKDASNHRTGIEILTGNGTGQFAPLTLQTTFTENAGLAVADLDGDGIQDVATTRPGDIVTFRNLGGNLGLGPPVVTSGVALSGSIAAGDLNHDGRPELVTGNRGSGDVSVFLNSGSGSFSHLGEYSFASSRLESAVAIADMNGDTHPDVVTVSDGVVGVLNGNGTGALSVGTQAIVVAPGSRVLTLADLNQDGRPDIAVAGSGAVSVILNAGSGSFLPAVTVTARGEHRAIVARDVNQDGLPDLCVTNDTEGTVSVLLGNGAGAFSQSFVQWGAGYRPSGLAAGDVTEDGFPDLVAVQDGYLMVMPNLGGTPPYNPGPTVRAPDIAYVADGGTLKFDVTAMDLNGDPIDGMFAAPLGAASFVVNPSHTLGTYSWSPVTSDIGFNSVNFSAFNSGGVGNAHTSMEVVPSGTALTGRLIWNPAMEVAGTFYVCFGATNQAGDTVTTCTTVTVVPPGGSARAAGAEPRTAARSTSSAPTLSVPSSIAALAGQPMTFGVWASNATSLFVDTSGLPGAVATFAADGPPTLSAPSVVYATPGVPVTVNVSAADPQGDAFTLLADRSAFPAGNMPSFTTNGANTTGALTWTPTAADNGKAFGVTFRVTNALWSSAPTLIQVGLRPTVYYKENGNPNEESGGAPLQALSGSTFAYATGRLGQGADFDGTSSHAIGITPGVQYDFATNFTAECWVKVRPPVPSANSMVLIARGSSQGGGGVWPNWHFEVYGTSAGSLTGMVRFAVEPGVGFFVNSSHRVDDGNFHHLAATYDGVTMRLYLDGALEGSTSATGLSVGMVNGLFQVGGGARVGTTSLPLNGTVDEIRIWHVLRSQSDLQASKDSELFTTITAVEETAPVLRTALAANRPNPFNPHTEIRFELARGSQVQLRIFDVSGRLVRELIDTTLPAGEHRAVWDGTDAAGRAAASGTYLYRLDAAGFNQTRKMVLLR